MYLIEKKTKALSIETKRQYTVWRKTLFNRSQLCLTFGENVEEMRQL